MPLQNTAAVIRTFPQSNCIIVTSRCKKLTIRRERKTPDTTSMSLQHGTFAIAPIQNENNPIAPSTGQQSTIGRKCYCIRDNSSLNLKTYLGPWWTSLSAYNSLNVAQRRFDDTRSSNGKTRSIHTELGSCGILFGFGFLDAVDASSFIARSL
jgi:hypothetical protein